MVPLLQDSPEVPVHVVTTRYGARGRFGRRHVSIQVSERLDINTPERTPDEIVTVIREQMLQMSGQTYVDRYAQEVKAELRGNQGNGLPPARITPQ